MRPGIRSQSKLALRDEVGASPLEPGREQGHPGLAQGGLAEQQLDRLVGAHRGRREHVVEGRPVDVHHHGAVAERLADRARHLPQHVLEVLLGAHRRGALEHGAEPADHGQGSRVQHGIPPSEKRMTGKRDGRGTC